MKALWAAGPRRGQVEDVRDRFVSVLRQPATPWTPRWMENLDEPVAVEREVFYVMAYAVGDRAWRVLVPEVAGDTLVVQALIDAEPADLALVEVGV